MKVMWPYSFNVDRELFVNEGSGRLVRITGTDPQLGPWEHVAFVPSPLPPTEPVLSGVTYRRVSAARAALAALDATSRRLPNPRLLRTPSLRREAQATSALEGTYAPFEEILAADASNPLSADLREVLNYVVMAEHAFAWVEEGRPLTISVLEELQGALVAGTPSGRRNPGQLRSEQVVVGRRDDADPRSTPVHAARYIPPPPGHDLRAGMDLLLSWIGRHDPDVFDPVVAAAMAHYQFEALHPFQDDNGRLGRLLIVVTLMLQKAIAEPTLTVSPWFEARRSQYYDRLFAVSCAGDWDAYIRFFATGLEASANETHAQLTALIDVRQELRDIVQKSSLRADSARRLIDYAVASPSFSVAEAAPALDLSPQRTGKLVQQLVGLRVLAPIGDAQYARRFHAPRVWDVLLVRSRPASQTGLDPTAGSR